MPSLLTPQPKKAPHLLKKRDQQRATAKVDREENIKVKARSGGHCEARVVVGRGGYRCACLALHIHHLLGGIGRRNKGRSILAEHKLHLCTGCHSEIHGHVLVPCVPKNQAESAATIRYRRVT